MEVICFMPFGQIRLKHQTGNENPPDETAQRLLFTQKRETSGQPSNILTSTPANTVECRYTSRPKLPRIESLCQFTAL